MYDSDYEVFPPFPPKSITYSTHTTYLDSIGRPAITLEYSQLTDRQYGIIYVSDMISLVFLARANPLYTAGDIQSSLHRSFTETSGSRLSFLRFVLSCSCCETDRYEDSEVISILKMCNSKNTFFPRIIHYDL